MSSPIAGGGGGAPYSSVDAGIVKQDNPDTSSKGDIEGRPDVKPNTPPPDTEGNQKTTQQMSEMEINEHKDVKPSVAPSGDDSERTDSIVEGATPPIAGDTEETGQTGTDVAQTAEQGAEELVASADTGAPKETAITDKKKEAATGDKPAEGGEGESQSGEGEQQTV